MNLIQLLMTPDKTLVTVFSYFFMFWEAIFFLKLSGLILKQKLKIIKQVLFVSITVVSAIIANTFFKNHIGDLINIATYIILLNTLFKTSVKDIFVVIITSYISILIPAYLTETSFMFILSTSSHEIENIPLYYIISCIFSFVYIFLIYLLVKYKNKLLPTFNISLNTTVIINLILGIIAIFIQSYVISVYMNLIPLGVASTICLLIYFLTSMYSLTRTNKLEKTAKDLEAEKLYNKTLSLLHDNIRCFKHDFDNIIQSLGGYIDLNDMDGLRAYYTNLLGDCKQTNNLNMLNPNTINNPSIFSLLTNKYYLANEKGVTITFDIFTDLNKINFNIYEITRILGILIDNAIEAAQVTTEKLVEIEFRSATKKQLFIITNSCKDMNISTTKIFEKGYSTKDKNSGIGLWEVHKILSKNTNLDLFTTIQKNKFKQQLEVFF